ncbi:NfeD family protein [Aneurinibacillus sp. BA2021]|nr:NfeD family protein [Aneurinibacillus sp. BA2021]
METQVQISGFTSGTQTPQTIGKPTEVRQNEVVTATVKQRLSSNEAVIEIKGQAYQAVFDKEIPVKGEVPVQITDVKGNTVYVRVVPASTTQTGGSASLNMEAERLLKDAGVKVTAEMREAVSRLLAERVPVSKEVLQRVQHVMQHGAGNVQQKLDTLSLMAQKKITVTPKSYEAVFRALHGPSLDKIVAALAEEAPDLVPVQTQRTSAPQENQGARTPPAEQKLSRQLDLLAQVVESGKPVSKEQLQKLLDQMKRSVEASSISEPVRKHVGTIIKQVEQAISETGRQETVTADKLAQNVQAKDIIRAASEIKRAAQAKQPVTPTRQTESMPVNRPGAPLVRQIDTLQQALQSKQPISKEQLATFIEQMQRSPEVKNMPKDVGERFQQALAQLTRLIKSTPDSQPYLSPEKVAQTVQTTGIENDLKQARGFLVRKEAAVKPQPTSSAPEIKEVPAAKTEGSAIKDLANLVVDARLSGKVTRGSIDQLQKAIERVVGEVKLSPQLQKDLQTIVNRIMKDLRMSISYEAVGKEAEAKAMVGKTLDTLVKVFKLPIAEITAQRSNPLLNDSIEDGDGTGDFLRPVSETLIKLGSLIGLAQQELAAALGKGMETVHPLEGVAVPRSPLQIVQDTASSLRQAAQREKLPQQEMRQMEQLLQRLEAAATDDTSHPERIMDGMKELEQLLTQAGERMAALTNVQTANFERVTHYIPDYLREVGREFTQLKKEITNNVERMTQFIEQKIPQAPSYIQRIVEPTIEMVNRLVNKGEFALFADMEFEHSVLKISGELQQVKGMLDKGRQDEALQLFHRVKGELEKLHWQPSYMKVERFFSKTTLDGEMRNPFQTYGQSWQEGTLTGRGVQEMMRSVGYTHEKEAMDWLLRREGMAHAGSGRFGGELQDPADAPPSSMKSHLLDSMDRSLTPRAREVMEQALSNITGQQLLSRQEPTAPIQTMHIQLPLPWEEGMHTAELQVHARNNGQQMDWENCSLFFFLDTPKFGETGVSVMVVNREMTIRVQNDHPHIDKVFGPYVPQMEEALHQLGYRINGVTFTPIGQEKQTGGVQEAPLVDTALARSRAIQQSGQEGLDFSI